MTPEGVRRYFEARLPGQRWGSGAEVKSLCPFHSDSTPSLSINLEKGVWQCFAGCGGGGVLDFEEKFSKCDRETARRNVQELLGGERVFTGSGGPPEAVYQYRDAVGVLLFEKLRYPGKRFVQRKPVGKSGWDYKLGDIRRPLYRLPELIVANDVVVVEGEKDADNVLAAFAGRTLPDGVRVAATTNFDGAGKWRSEYAPYFAGKRVVIFPDNDTIGRKHAEDVAASVYPYAYAVKVVPLPELSDHGDVSDYLKAHSADDLLAEIKKTPVWRPSPQKLFVPASAFVLQVPDTIDWLVENVIQRGANGFFVAIPKGGKSYVAIDLAISLALGVDWMGFTIPRPARVALISREDAPELTGWRLKHIFAGKSCPDPGLIETNLYVNSRRQSAELMLDNPEQMGELLAALRQFRPELVIVDVFNVVHSADENDNQAMRGVLRELSAIQAEIGCSIAVVHHYNKNELVTSMTQRMRGSSAIAGWAEWLIGISMADEESKLRRMDFETKAATPPAPLHFRIVDNGSTVRMEVVEPTAASRSRGSSAAEQLMAKGRVPYADN
jgi:hypothetical protein